ncbi:hypothetical protein NNJEOMEG_00144 [Fundidesulfovibrio magnetotacticus]|uniref:EcsC protein family protein n=1 Tax=Fundidesulfovibrio magnetotacticus TaxID=2730080 RepID=A0A6V8LMT9_9BACT|nr:EcsC family protein [Fundidesulfovibrio magnetotacticus]GFK92320.1 hypothetical protein NNJEOMEG_00144 [Fundidesulfovibrio magnetotacticus]
MDSPPVRTVASGKGPGEALDAQAMEQLRTARSLLEHRSLSHRFLTTLGTPVDQAYALLPRKARDAIAKGARGALLKLSEYVISHTMNEEARSDQSRLHKWGVMLSGGIGGFGGLASLPVEITVSTSIMLRSIAALARHHGEDLRRVEARLACIEVFGLEGDHAPDEPVLASYFTTRSLFAQEVRTALTYMAAGAQRNTLRPSLVRMVEFIAPRFGVMLEEKFLAQSLPLAGAIGGAALNAIFLDHYQRTARGHFMIRRLEREWGAQAVRSAVASLD